MGCGWTAKDTDFSRVQAIEVSNGAATRATGDEEGEYCGIPFWQTQLNRGLRITGIGGSDNHDPSLAPDVASAVGMPTTVIEADGLSEGAILDAIVRGRVAIDLDGTADRTLDLVARAGLRQASMGGTLIAPPGERVDFEIIVQGVAAGRVEVIHDGQIVTGPRDPAIAAGKARHKFSLIADGAARWTRINVRNAAGRLIMIGNPIYLSAG